MRVDGLGFEIPELSSNPFSAMPLEGSKSDLYVGGVPCQAWSVAGKKEGFKDPRGKLWEDCIRIVGINKPKAFIFENVKGLYDPRNRSSLELIVNEFKKKGISITPVKFGISFTTIHLNQAGALVHVYTDGSIHMNHGGIEMGQGTHTKIAQLVANSFGLPYEKVQISSTNTSKVPNTSASAASSTTDLNGAATLNAVSKIKLNINNFIKKKYKIFSKTEPIYKNGNIYIGNRIFNFEQIIKEAYLNRISLSSSGFYSTPKINFNKKIFKGRPFYYFCYGAAVSEVTIDTFTGESVLDRVDILHDVGNAINPALEHGQIEGGFVQGQGWLTMEEVVWDKLGKKIMKYSKIRKQIRKLLKEAEMYENLMYYKKADELRNRAYFLSQVLEEKSRGY